jgi:hypothetical protein
MALGGRTEASKLSGEEEWAKGKIVFDVSPEEKIYI